MKSLKWKIVTALAVLVLAALAASGGYILFHLLQNEYEQLTEETRYLSERIVNTLQAADSEENNVEDMLSELIGAWMLESAGTESSRQNRAFFLLDEQGQTLYHRGEDLKESERGSRAVTAAIVGEPLGRLSVSGRMAEWAEAFELSGTRYILLTRQSLAPLYETLRHTVTTILIAIGIGMLLAAVVGYFVASGITKPLLTLSHKTQRLASGELEPGEKRTEESEDELDLLSDSFDDMARALSAMIGELNQEKDKLNIIFRYMTDGLLLYGADGRLLEWNPAAVSLLGEQLTEQSFDEAFAPRRIGDSLQERTGSSYLLQTEGGFVSAVLAPFYNEQEQQKALLAVLRDVTESRKMEALQKEFVGNVSHELRTPVTMVKSYVETLLEDDELPADTRRQFLGVIDNEADRMTQLITELLELSRMDSQGTLRSVSEIDLVFLLKEAMSRSSFAADAKQQTLVYEGAGEVPLVRGNSGQLSRVFRNLINNAIAYSEAGTVISAGVVLAEEETELRAFVQDRGLGIDPKDQKRIFERFYRVDKARSRSAGGTGLGLAICKEIMELHGGRIWVESKPGEGSTFWIALSLPDKAEASHEA